MYQHDAQLANIVTSYCTCLGGVMPLLYCVLAKTWHPTRWMFAYLCVLVTGVPTVWLHSVEGHMLASFFDVGTNILLVWAVQVAAAGDFLARRPRRILLGTTTLFCAFTIAWLLAEVVRGTKSPVLTFGEFGQFYFGEAALIANAWIVAILFAMHWNRVPSPARRLLLLTLGLFLGGMFMATASNSEVSLFIIPWHAAWHIVGAFGFITLWFFNQTRFFPPSPVAPPA